MWTRLIGLVLVTGFIAIGFATTAYAADYRGAAGSTRVAADEVIEDDLFIAGDVIEIDGEVTGDVYAAGEHITIHGIVGGDVFAAGSHITLLGDISGSVRAVGQTVNLASSRIGGGVTFVGSTLSNSSEGTIGGGVTFLAETVTLNGPVAYGLTGYAASVRVNNQLGTGSRVSAEQFTIGADAVIHGPVEYRSDADVQVTPGARVNSELIRTGDYQQSLPELQFNRNIYVFWSFLSAVFAGTVLLFLFRKPMMQVAETVHHRWLLSFAIGFLTILLLLPVGLLLIMTLIGLPLAVLWWTALAAGLYISKFFVAIAVGSVLLQQLALKKPPSVLLSLLTGLTVIFLIKIVPFIGPLSTFAVAATGLGAVVVCAFSSRSADAQKADA